MRLPSPARERWQPLRAGLVDLFYYDEEEFGFRDGHLLLRGNNGTGKSKVLALLLPFLLEGDTAAHRVEPDGDPGKRMEWNLLLGGRHPHSERTGYAWCEFGRRTADGEQHLTVGAGLKAVAGRTGVRSWFFVTDRRVGQDLHLVGQHRTVLTRERLAEALGDRGRVHDQASRYRQAVNEALFDLAPERYEALLTLLVQLRQPQLSKRPDERRLSDALTEALPPLDAGVLADVAEAFRSLEDERLALAAHTEARDAAATFLDVYRLYARTAARRQAEGPRRAQSRYEETGRRLAAAREALTAARLGEQEAQDAALAVADDQVTTRERERVLRDSPQMRSAQELRHAEDAAGQARERTEAAAREVTAAGTELDRRRDAERVAAQEQERATTNAAELAEHAASAARAAGAPPPDPGHPEARRRAEHEVSTREAAVRQVLPLAEAVRAAGRRRNEAERDRETAAQAVDAATAERDAAASVVEETAEQLLANVRAWLDGAEETRRAAQDHLPHDVLERLDGWVESLEGPDPVAVVAAAAGRAAAAALGAKDAAQAARDRDLAAERLALEEERDRLAAGADLAPPPPATRDVAGRQGRPGAPLWQLVDFADGVDPAARAGLEAALEASGLLDAWVTPEGGLLDADDTAVVLSPAVPVSAARVLMPAVDRGDLQAAAVDDGVVRALVGSIGLGPATGPTWVDVDGRYRVGPLEGRWRKPVAAYVGSGAREQARRARLTQIASALDGVANRRDEVAAAREDLRRRRGAVDAELAAAPSGVPLHTAHTTLHDRTSRLAAATEALGIHDRRVREAVERHEEASRACDSAASDRDVPADVEGLHALRHALDGYRAALAGLWPALAARDVAARALASAGEEAAAAGATLERRQAQQRTAREESGRLAARAQALQAAVGAEVAELERRLADVEERLRTLEADARRLEQRRLALARAVGDAEGRESELAQQLGADGEARAAATQRLQAFAASGLLEIALPGLETPDPASGWAPTPAVLVARAVEAALADVPAGDEDTDRLTRQVTEHLAGLGEVLSRSGDHVSHLPGDVGITVTPTFRGQETTVTGLVAGLDAELAERERLLSARERDLLERHLVEDVAARLQELIRAAENQVGRMNAELAARPTSTGMHLRLVWQPVEDGPAGLAEARARLLRQTSDAWSEADRTAVGSFLQAQIAAVRARDEGGTWADHLAAALDYRAWHRFAVLRRQDGRWRPAAGPASGGERVLAATIPLFAAAASHYASAGNAAAPRLVLLDEAFAGVDDDSRAKCLGLLAEFDLDYVLTSEREWGCYPTVPGLAIAQLSRREGIDAVLVTRWEWDGTARHRVGDPPRSALHAAAVPGDAAPGEHGPAEAALWS